MDIPVYLFTGFLGSGKTKFIQETLEDNRFNAGERTLLLLCEEGEEEYAPDTFAFGNVFIRNVEEEDELTEKLMSALEKELKIDRVVVEYNGMWSLDTLYQNMPENWAVQQEFCFADFTTFEVYNRNMRQQMVDKLKSCEMLVVNRVLPGFDKMPIHQIVRAVSRRCDIAYEYADGNVEYDDIEDPLPFDLAAPVVEIKENDYAVWYRDLGEDTEKYVDKTLRIKVMAVNHRKGNAETFVIGRQLMTCCVADIQFAGIVCRCPGMKRPSNKSWVTIQGRMDIQTSPIYGKKGPVLIAESITPDTPPEEEVATFY